MTSFRFESLKGVRTSPSLGRKQSGVALMIVIMVFALVSILAVGIYKRQKLFIYSSSNFLASAQAYEYALGSETYARRLLKADWDEDKKDNKFIDDQEQVKSALLLPVDNAILEAQFNDVHGKLNLNDLVSVDGVPNQLMQVRFKRLLDRLAIEQPKFERIQDWIDENQEATGIEGVEDGEYLGLNPPFRTGGQPFVHVSELLLIEGLTQDDYEAILPFISVLPQGRAHINVNTASAEIFQSLIEDLPDNQAQDLVAQAESKPWESVQEFKTDPLLKGAKIDFNYLDVYSNFFEVATRITLSERQVRLRSLLYRDKSDGSISLVQRDQGQKYLITKDQVGL
jgi:general secretion pathway protein K